MRELEIGKTYRHFKGNIYIVENIALDSENMNEKVIYRALYGDQKLWVRDKKDFLSEVGERKDNITNQKYRFEPYEGEQKNIFRRN